MVALFGQVFCLYDYPLFFREKSCNLRAIVRFAVLSCFYAVEQPIRAFFLFFLWLRHRLYLSDIYCLHRLALLSTCAKFPQHNSLGVSFFYVSDYDDASLLIEEIYLLCCTPCLNSGWKSAECSVMQAAKRVLGSVLHQREGWGTLAAARRTRAEGELGNMDRGQHGII